MFTEEKTYYVYDLGQVPAMCNIITGCLFLNASIWDLIPKNQQTFIRLHEEGHLALQTTDDELACDAYASEKYFKLGLPLSDSVLAISEYLIGKNQEDWNRLEAQAARCREGEKAGYQVKGKIMTNPKIEMLKRTKRAGRTSTKYDRSKGYAGMFWDKYKIYTQAEIANMNDNDLFDAIAEAKEDIADYEAQMAQAMKGKMIPGFGLWTADGPDMTEVSALQRKIDEIKDNIKKLEGQRSFLAVAAPLGGTGWDDFRDVPSDTLDKLLAYGQNDRLLDYNKDMYALQTGQNAQGTIQYLENMKTQQNKDKYESYSESAKYGVNGYQSENAWYHISNFLSDAVDSVSGIFGGGSDSRTAGQVAAGQGQSAAAAQMGQAQIAAQAASQQRMYIIAAVVVLIIIFFIFNKNKS